MDEWMNGWMDGRVVGWMDGWVGGQMDGWIGCHVLAFSSASSWRKLSAFKVSYD